ncbi:MAG: lipid-binding SYLF domain-containing protein [Thermoguttaceae bacterium]|jgi:lipid-binding SYLF domain-containing protein
MKTSLMLSVLSACGLLCLAARPAPAQLNETATVDASSQVLSEIMMIPAWRIPASLLANAQGIAVVPGVVKGGFIVGVRFGRGIVVVRDDAGNWRPPVFVSLTGGSVGWQIGVQATDVILVFKTRGSIRGLMSGKFTLGADAAVAAGPVGRQAEAATDIALRAEILSYSRSRGLFLGVSLDGSVVQVDGRANALYYGGPGFAGPQQPIPPSAVRLMQQVTQYCGGPAAYAAVQPMVVAPPMVVPQPVPIPGSPAPMPLPTEPELRRQLHVASQQLDMALDGNWRAYLALPAEVHAGGAPPGAEALRQSLGRFDGVAGDPRYYLLAARPEFRRAHDLLRSYVALPAAVAPPPSLPGPPLGPSTSNGERSLLR